MTKIHVVVQKVNRISIEQHFGELVECLYPERKSRVLAFRRKEPAYTSIVAGLMLQTLIEQKLGIAPCALVLEKNENGKPMVQGHPEFYFNLSHAGDYVVLAYGDVPLGIDIERIRPQNLRVAKRCYTEAEYAYVTGVDTGVNQVGDIFGEKQSVKIGTDEVLLEPERDINDRFFYLWTMKEAYLKLTGDGISVPLNSFEIDPVQKIVKGTPYRYYMQRMDEYWISLCTGENCEIEYDYIASPEIGS